MSIAMEKFNEMVLFAMRNNRALHDMLLNWKDEHLETISTEIHTSMHELERRNTDLRYLAYQVKAAASNLGEFVIKNCDCQTYKMADRDTSVNRYTVMIVK